MATLDPDNPLQLPHVIFINNYLFFRPFQH